MTRTTDYSRPPRLHPVLAAVGAVTLVILGLILIFALATAVALIIGYALLAAALVLMVYALITAKLRKSARSSSPSTELEQ